MTEIQKRRCVHVVTTKTVKTYSYLFHAAQEAFDHANEDDEGLLYDCLSAIMFCALTIEAYFNHIGSITVSYWSYFERKLTPRDKLNLLAEVLSISINFEIEPFNHFSRLFWFRNFTAHGKTITEESCKTHKLLPGERTPISNTEWEQECTRQKAELYLKATRGMVNYLHNAIGETDPPFLFPSSASYEASVVNPEYKVKQ